MCFIEEKYEILKNLGKFSYGEKQWSGPMEWNLMKSRFSVKFMRLCDEKWYKLWLTGFFFFFFWISEKFEDFS